MGWNAGWGWYSACSDSRRGIDGIARRSLAEHHSVDMGSEV